jgi:NADH-quinone oxidoreductase subunit F
MQVIEKTRWSGLKVALGMPKRKVIERVKSCGLTGRSGSEFPTGLKWESMAKERGKKYLICNADEGEPGTFKDKFILDNNPKILIEGMAIAAYAMGIREAYIYLRGEYSYLKKKLERAIRESGPYIEGAGLEIKVVLGAGSYLCGEESALIESIEGNRPIIRKKPPFPTEYGLYGKPTCVNNVETLSYIPLIILGKWNPNLLLFSLSGDLKNPGVYEIAAGTTLKDVLAYAKPSMEPKAVYFGASGGCLPYKLFRDLPIDAKSVSENGAILGARSLIVVGQKWNAAEISKVLSEFFVHESCGYCTPCREGNFRLLEILNRMCSGKGENDDIAHLEKLAPHIRDTSACALGKVSTAHLLCGLKYFRENFVELAKGKKSIGLKEETEKCR